MSFSVGGNPVFKSCRTTDKELAQEIMEREIRKRREQLFTNQTSSVSGVYSRDMCLEEAIQRAFKERPTWAAGRTHYLKPNTKKVLSWLGNKRLIDIDEGDYHTIVQKCLEQNPDASSSHIRNHCGPLTTILTMAKNNWKILSTIPSPTCVPKKKRKKKKNYFTEDVERRILDFFNTYENPTCPDNTPLARETGLLVQFAIDTGLRSGELCQIRWRDIDHDLGPFGTIILDPEQGLRIKKDKYREVPLTDRAARVLRQMKTKVYAIPKAYDRIWERSYDRYDGQMELMRRHIFKEGELNYVPALHICRHTYITRLWQCGIDGPTIMELAGHDSLETTRLYSHSDRTRRNMAAERLGDMSNGRAKLITHPVVERKVSNSL